MIDYEKEFGKPGYQIGARQVQIAATFKIVYGWMCAGLALSGVIAWYTAASGLWQKILQGPAFMGCILGALTLYLDFINLFLHILRFLGRKR